MGLDRVPSGKSLPNDFNVIIEIPMHADPVKYEVDKDSGAVFVDRFMSTAMHYPCNYGYIPHTIAGDGDPVDVLVVTQFALPPGVVVRCRPIGLLAMDRRGRSDGKLLAVPVDSLTPMYRDIESPRDFPQMVLDQIAHFFAHYKDLEPRQVRQGRRLAGQRRSQEGNHGRRQGLWKPRTSRPSERLFVGAVP
jgi:inorganic pyrophosphatase